jgi:sugar/nucleoside kinase (ribokinase family)
VSLLVVGTVAFDSIETPVGMVDRVLGGSATFFSYAASFFTRPRLVAVVGEDFPDENRRLLADRKVDTAGLQTQPGGKTFFWKGRYHQDMNTRDTIELHLNVLETFDPVVPEAFRDSTHVFLANSGPATQARVLDQMKSPKLVAADTMDFWITTQLDDLMKLLPRLDLLFLNDSEARLLTGEDNMVRAGRKVRDRGPKYVVIKRGEYGAMLSTPEGDFALPAYPTDQVIDPTGAGDTFAGGLLGHLIAEGGSGVTSLRRAMAYGTVLASLTVEGFGLDRLRRTDEAEIRARLERYRAMLAV